MEGDATDKEVRDIFGLGREAIAFKKLPVRITKLIEADPKDIEALDKDVALRLSSARKDGTERRSLDEFYRRMVDPDAHASASGAVLKKAGIRSK